MNKQKETSFLKNITFLITLLTFFLLWVFLSPQIENLYVKKVLKIEKEDTKINFINSVERDLDLENFWKVYSLVKSEYYWVDWLDKEKLVNWAISWLIESLWDKHSEFMSAEITKRFNETLSWDFQWIWAVVEKNPLWVQVERVIKWSPAEKNWITSRDIIIKADETSLEELDLYDAVDKIKWPAWTKVLLTIVRQWEEDLLKIEITRANIKIPSVSSKIIEESNLGYIEVNMFWENTAKEFEQELNKLKDTDWLIIDLRFNWWGYLQSAVEMLWNFIEKGEILVKTKYKSDFFDTVYKSLWSDNMYNKKMVIIMNGSSASASEIMAWALSDYNKAIIVWEKSYWKWSVQQPFDIKWWNMLKLTIAKWFTPNWINIDEHWINPDIEIKFQTEDFKNSYDRQLEEAKKILNEFIKYWSINLVVDKYKNAWEM